MSDAGSADSGTILYGVDARPPAAVLAVAGAQHALAMFPGVVMVPLIVARGIGASPEESARLVVMAILVSGLTTLLQVSRLGPLGSGYLCVMGSSSLFIQPGILAGKAGGLPLVFGMTLLMAPLQAVISRFAKGFRRLCPPAVTGTIIMLIAVSIVPISFRLAAGGPGSPTFGHPRHLFAAMVTIVVVALCSTSGRTMLRIGAMVIGTVAGALTAACLGLTDFAAVAAATPVALPRLFAGHLAVDPAFILPFAVVYFISALESYGDMNAIGEISEGGKPPAPERISAGMLTDAVGSALAGFMGTTANTSFSGNIALVRISGVAARRVGWVAGGILVVLSLFPKLAAVITSMPSSVIGGGMIVAVAMLFAIGMHIAGRDAGGNRNLLVIGLSLAVGLGVQSVPEGGDMLPAAIRQLVLSPTCSGTLCAILLRLFLPGKATPPQTADDAPGAPPES